LRWTILWFGLVALGYPATAQIFLVTGSQSPKSAENSASIVYQVSDQGALSQVQEISSASVGTWSLEISYEHGLLFAVTPSAANTRAQLRVIDLNTGKLTKECTLPRNPSGFMDIEEWIADRPSHGPALIRSLVSVNPQGRVELVQSMLADPSIPC
jgi:hypothetical protein